MSIRLRLSLWFLALLGGMLLFFAILLTFTLRYYLMSEVDRALRLRASQIHGTLNVASDTMGSVSFDMIHAQFPPINEFAAPGLYIQMMDRAGTVLLSSENLRGQRLPVDASVIERGAEGKPSLLTLPAGSERVRVYTTPLHVKDRDLLLQVARSLHDVDGTLRQVLYIIVPGILGALVLAAISAWFLAQKAIKPVNEITQTARRIEEGADLAQRVAYEGPPDEVGKLAETFNRMIARIEGFVESQKHFVADASHELRTPLTVLRGNLDLLKRDMPREDREESLRAMEGEAARMGKIVADLLLLAQMDAQQPFERKQVRLNVLLQEVYEEAQSLADGRQISLLRNDPFELMGDSEALRRLVTNLVGNAIRYTPAGGSMALSLRYDGEWARLAVADTGIGIPPDHLPHIFDRFYRVDKSRSRAEGGTGLGLTIAKGIAEAHGGRITVASEPGEGSTFTLWLKV